MCHNYLSSYNMIYKIGSFLSVQAILLCFVLEYYYFLGKLQTNKLCYLWTLKFVAMFEVVVILLWSF